MRRHAQLAFAASFDFFHKVKIFFYLFFCAQRSKKRFFFLCTCYESSHHIPFFLKAKTGIYHPLLEVVETQLFEGLEVYRLSFASPKKKELKMSQKLAKNLNFLLQKASGSHLTKEARAQTASDFARVLEEKKFQIKSVAQIKIKHLQAYISVLAERNLSARTIANRMSHLRTALRAAGKERMLLEDKAKNSALGVRTGSRIGTKVAMTEEKFHEIKINLAKKSEGFALIAELQRALGLRQQEALRGATVDTLSRWEKELLAGYAKISLGTKGGRERETLVQRQTRALEAVQNALKYAQKNSGYVLRGKDYKSALTSLQYAYRASGMVGEYSSHSLRYAFAQEQYKFYKDSGLTDKAARVEVSKDLGHGSGRDRWIKSVYLRN